jgi:hypothetical protein
VPIPAAVREELAARDQGFDFCSKFIAHPLVIVVEI